MISNSPIKKFCSQYTHFESSCLLEFETAFHDDVASCWCTLASIFRVLNIKCFFISTMTASINNAVGRKAFFRTMLGKNDRHLRQTRKNHAIDMKKNYLGTLETFESCHFIHICITCIHSLFCLSLLMGLLVLWIRHSSFAVCSQNKKNSLTNKNYSSWMCLLVFLLNEARKGLKVTESQIFYNLGYKKNNSQIFTAKATWSSTHWTKLIYLNSKYYRNLCILLKLTQ